VLERAQLFELEEIILEQDKEAALKFLENNIYKPISLKNDGRCNPR